MAGAASIPTGPGPMGPPPFPAFRCLNRTLLASVTDFATNAGNSFTTNLSYDANGFVKQVRDPLLHSTSFERIASTGIPTKITHPADSHGVVSSVAYSYMDPDGYYLGSVTDERGKVTTYHRNLNNMTTSEIDYPDGGVESFDYNQFNQTWHHTMPSSTTANGAGATEVFTNDSRGMLQSYTPPGTASDPNPASHPTTYAYDSYDHLATVTDPRGNSTSYTYNAIGQLLALTSVDGSQVNYAYNGDGTRKSTSVQFGPNSGDLAETDTPTTITGAFGLSPPRSASRATPPHARPYSTTATMVRRWMIIAGPRPSPPKSCCLLGVPR